MPDAARMGNQGEEGAGGVDKGAGADAGEDDDVHGGDGDAGLEMLFTHVQYLIASCDHDDDPQDD